jgi:hypothetical protein
MLSPHIKTYNNGGRHDQFRRSIYVHAPGHRGELYACMLAYFGGLVGTKRPQVRIVWNSEPILWIITRLLTFSIVFKIVQTGVGEGSGVWYLIGTGNLMVIYIYLVIELSRHDLPKIGYWGIAALAAAPQL